MHPPLHFWCQGENRVQEPFWRYWIAASTALWRVWRNCDREFATGGGVNGGRRLEREGTADGLPGPMGLDERCHLCLRIRGFSEQALDDRLPVLFWLVLADLPLALPALDLKANADDVTQQLKT
jgi:hypothetical protein